MSELGVTVTIPKEVENVLGHIRGLRLDAWYIGCQAGYLEGYADAITAEYPNWTVQAVIDELEARGIHVPDETRALWLS